MKQTIWNKINEIYRIVGRNFIIYKILIRNISSYCYCLNKIQRKLN